MSGTQGWTQSVDGPEMFREMQKRLDRLERVVTAPPLQQVLGPGIADRGIEVKDWNAEEATFNGFFYSEVDAENTPDPTVRWIGLVLAQNDNNGVQQVCEGQAPEGEEPILPDDPETVIPTEEEPEPEQPHVGNRTPVRQYIRYYSTSPEGVANFTEWQPLGLVTGARIADLADVKVFEPLLEKSILVWDPIFNGVGGWVSSPYIPGVAEALAKAEDALEAAAGAIDTIEDLPPVYRQPSAPVPGVAGVPNPLPANSRWFDSDAGNKPYLWSTATNQWLAVYTDLTSVTITGSLYVGGQINGTTLTGQGLQTSTAANTGVKITNTGIVGYGAGVPKFTLLASDGSLALAGPAIVGGDISGATVTGGILRTGTTGERMVIRNDGSSGVMEFFTGLAGEVQPGRLNPDAYGNRPSVVLSSGTSTANNTASFIQFIAGVSDSTPASPEDRSYLQIQGGHINLSAPSVQVGSPIRYPWTGGSMTGGWVPVTLPANGFSEFAGQVQPAYRLDAAGHVHFRGRFNRGTAVSGATLVTVPAAFRPIVEQERYIRDNVYGGCALVLQTDGQVRIYWSGTPTWFGIGTSILAG